MGQERSLVRSSSPVDATLDDQADAFAVLLEELGVQRLPRIGISVGALSALPCATPLAASPWS